MSVASAEGINPSVFGGGGSQTLAQVLTTGNSAGSSDIDMNNNDITGANAITCATLNYTTLNPPVGGVTSNYIAYNPAPSSNLTGEYTYTTPSSISVGTYLMSYTAGLAFPLSASGNGVIGASVTNASSVVLFGNVGQTLILPFPSFLSATAIITIATPTTITFTINSGNTYGSSWDLDTFNVSIVQIA